MISVASWVLSTRPFTPRLIRSGVCPSRRNIRGYDGTFDLKSIVPSVRQRSLLYPALYLLFMPWKCAKDTNKLSSHKIKHSVTSAANVPSRKWGGNCIQLITTAETTPNRKFTLEETIHYLETRYDLMPANIGLLSTRICSVVLVRVSQPKSLPR